jgi:hypothetical protein
LYLYQPSLLMALYHSLPMVWATSAGGCVACIVYDEEGVASATALLTSASVLSRCTMASASRADGGRVSPAEGCDEWEEECTLIASGLRLTGV